MNFLTLLAAETPPGLGWPEAVVLVAMCAFLAFFVWCMTCPFWALWTLSKTKPFERRSRELRDEADQFIAEGRYDEFFAQQPEFDANMAAWDDQIDRSAKAVAPMAVLTILAIACLVLSAVTS